MGRSDRGVSFREQSFWRCRLQVRAPEGGGEALMGRRTKGRLTWARVRGAGSRRVTPKEGVTRMLRLSYGCGR